MDTPGLMQFKLKGQFVMQTSWISAMCYGCHTNGFRFDSDLVNFHFVLFLYFFLGLGFTLKA